MHSAFNVEFKEEPSIMTEGMDSADAVKWQEAAQTEFDSLPGNCVNYGRKFVDSKWVFKVKYKGDGSVDRFKAHVFAIGFTHVCGIDFGEPFSPAARFSTIRTLLLYSPWVCSVVWSYSKWMSPQHSWMECLKQISTCPRASRRVAVKRRAYTDWSRCQGAGMKS